MKTRELIPEYDSSKSFYRKAHVHLTTEVYRLQSYDTIVAEFHLHKKQLKINGWYSATTARHINEFICQYAPAFSTISKKEMKEKPIKHLHNH